MSATSAVDPDQVMQWLQDVFDPEIPVLSVVDLGIVRQVNWQDDTCIVTITPTYSGCPAMYEITSAITTALNQRGLANVKVQTVLSPAWTTDWMTPKGRQALQNYGIAPPRETAIDVSAISRSRSEPAVPCPLCGSGRTRLISQFGSTSCKALYRCSACGEPFDYFKAH
jgi:ring-1,2-phenylacetyl-CoA epoxidase subunit PaaD